MAGRFSIEAHFKARDGITASMGKIERGITGSLRRASRGLTALNGKFAAIHSRVRQFATAGLVAGGAVGLLAKNVIDTGAAFEEQMSAVGAVMLKTRDQIGELEQKAKELGATTKFTGTESAAAMEEMARAGFSTQDILSGVGGVLNAAAASGLEMAEVAEIVSGTLKGMGLETSEAGRVADVLALASSRTKSSIGSLGDSMSKVSSTARQLGVPLEDTVAAVALLQDVGLDASVAGSALNTMLTKISAPTAGLKKQMEEMGISFRKSNGDMKTMTQVMNELVKAAQESGGNMDQVAFFAELVGLRGQKAATNLKDLAKAGDFAKLQSALEEAEGSAKKMADLKLDNLSGDMTLLGSAVDSVKTKLFQTQSGPLRDVVQGWRDWVSANEDLIVQKVTDFVDAAKELGKVFGSEFIRSLKKTSGILSDIFGLPVEGSVREQKDFAKALGKVAGTAAALLPVYLGVVVTTKALTAATFLARGAMLAYRGTVIAVRAVIAAYHAVTKGAWAITILYKGTIWAVNAASRAAAVGQGILKGATAAASVVAGGATVTFGALAAAVGAVTAAVGALLVAWDQWNKLSAETEGTPFWEMFKGFFGAGEADTFGLEGIKDAVDKHQNDLARKRAAERARAKANVPTPPTTGAQGRSGGLLEALTGVPPQALAGDPGATRGTQGAPEVQLDPEAMSQLGLTAAELKQVSAALQNPERIQIAISDPGGNVQEVSTGGSSKVRLEQSGAF